MGRPRSAEARQRVIDSTLELLLAVGVEGSTVEAIAAHSGVAKSTIYRHFGTRESLLTEAARACVVQLPTPDSGSLADDLSELFGRYDSDENRQLNQLFPLLLDASRRDPEMQATMEELIAERQRPTRTVVQLAQLRGEVDPDLDIEHAMAIVIGPLVYRRMIADTELTGDFIDTVIPAAVAALRSTVEGS